jgi:hypothetical protein
LNKIGFFQASSSGLVATKLMTDFMSNVAPHLGLRRVDTAGILSAPERQTGSELFDEQESPEGLSVKRQETMVHLLLGGTIFPACYNIVFYRFLPGGKIIKGLLWGTLLWTAGQFVAVPMLGKGPFFLKKPNAAITYYLAHLVYGIAFSLGNDVKR